MTRSVLKLAFLSAVLVSATAGAADGVDAGNQDLELAPPPLQALGSTVGLPSISTAALAPNVWIAPISSRPAASSAYSAENSLVDWSNSLRREAQSSLGEYAGASYSPALSASLLSSPTSQFEAGSSTTLWQDRVPFIAYQSIPLGAILSR